jgi:hypothetical protein
MVTMNTTPTTVGPERRRSARISARRHGQLIVVRGLRRTSAIDCQVLDTSSGGAAIEVDRAADLPDDFYLIIEDQLDDKITCSVARRARTVLGVRFVSRPRNNVRVIIISTS